MASHGASDGSSSNSSSGQAHSYSGKRESSSKQRVLSIRIQPTIGPAFSLSLPTNTKISALKESISDKMGLSPQKMTLLLHNVALNSGTLTDNGISDGTEVRLVPAIESGVTTTNSVDPVAMMKHSMSGISDQQIDDFLNGKFPLSVAIRVGESVVVVNLHRAKVEEIEMEPPPHKKRCVRAHRPSGHDEVDYLESSSKHMSSSREMYRYLNSNHSSSDLMRASNCSPSVSHRSSRRKSHRTVAKGRHIESRHHPSSSTSYPLSQPDRSMLTYTHDLPGVPMETSVAIAAPPPMEGPIHAPIPRATPIISKDAPVMTTMTAPPHCSMVEAKSVHKEHEKSVNVESCSSEATMEVSSIDVPKSSCADSGDQNTGDDGSTSSSSGSSADANTDSCCSRHGKSKSISRSVQTDSEPAAKDRSRENREVRNSSRKDGKVVSRREIKLPESGISMKRKAVMEAISEILKKMYANTEKGRLPGSFKGRFSSEFTCDSDMREILHSKTTMTSYGSEGEEHDKAGCSEAGGSILGKHGSNLSKAKLEEQQQLKDKVANLKWHMQHRRALKMAKRKGERSPCGWMEALNCAMPGGKPKVIDRTGFGGLKRGFLLAD